MAEDGAINDVFELYPQIGSDTPFFALVDPFYEGIVADPPIRSMYPADLEPGKRHLALFLIQRFGGKALFDQERGSPRLRMRHAKFSITLTQAKRWIAHMQSAVDATPEFAEHRAVVMRYFEDAAMFLINTDPLQPAKD